MTASIDVVKPDGLLKKSWKKLGFKGTALAACGIAAAVQIGEAIYHTDGSPRTVAYYALEDTKADLRYYLTGRFFSRDSDRASHYIICEPAHFNTNTHQQIPAPPHLATTYNRMEDNLNRQIKDRNGELYSDLHIAFNHYEYPVVLFYKTDVYNKSYDYSYKIIGQHHEVNQDCTRLTPQQGEYITARQRGEPVPASKLGF